MSENTEESYSMYPNTNSPPPPPHANIRYPIYQNPVPMYAYPQSPYIYTAQTPNYHYKMMNQNQTISYQPTSNIPQQNGGKKKWNNNNSNTNNNNSNINGNTTNSNTTPSGMNPKTSQSYYPNQNYYANAMMNSYNTQNLNNIHNNNINNINTSTNVTNTMNGVHKSNAATASYDPYKFDPSKVIVPKNIDLSNDLPIFFNTTFDEFIGTKEHLRQAEKEIKKKIELKEKVKEVVKAKKLEKAESNELESFKSENSTVTSLKSTEKEKEKEKEKEPIVKKEFTPPTTASVTSSTTTATVESLPDNKTPGTITTPVSIITSSTTKELPSSDEHDSSVSSQSTTDISATPSVTRLTPVNNTPAVVKSPARSWSSIASSAIPKGKPVIVSKPTISSRSNFNNASQQQQPQQQQPPQQQSFNQQPQKKNKKYVPPNTKYSEPLGALALRMCFDPDYINYTLNKPTDSNSKLPVTSIIPRGIVNNANICFMSSVLQVLLYCKPFVEILNVLSTRNVNSRISASTNKLIDACFSMYKQFDRETFTVEKKSKSNENANEPINVDKLEYASSADAINPDDFYRTLSTLPKFKDLQWGHQEDAEEFLTHLLDQLHEELISSIDILSDNEILNILQSINDEQLKIFFIRNLGRYKKADFIKNGSTQLKDMMNKYGAINDDNNENEGWHEVSSTGKKGKKQKAAAKRTVEVIPSPISNLFGGQFRSVLDIPNNKESQSITLDPFQTIQLDISDKDVNDLESAFKKFSEYELLPFKSSNGNDVEAKKQTFIDKLPQVLLIQLKRFSFVNNTEEDKVMANYNSYNGRIEKIKKKINYSHDLIIPGESVSSHDVKYSEANRHYKLTGVIYHHGVSPDGGHYTADIYHGEQNKWYRIDDINIEELKFDEVLKGNEDGSSTRTAYILMYQKI